MSTSRRDGGRRRTDRRSCTAAAELSETWRVRTRWRGSNGGLRGSIQPQLLLLLLLLLLFEQHAWFEYAALHAAISLHFLARGQGGGRGFGGGSVGFVVRLFLLALRLDVSQRLQRR